MKCFPEIFWLFVVCFKNVLSSLISAVIEKVSAVIIKVCRLINRLPVFAQCILIFSEENKNTGLIRSLDVAKNSSSKMRCLVPNKTCNLQKSVFSKKQTIFDAFHCTRVQLTGGT